MFSFCVSFKSDFSANIKTLNNEAKEQPHRRKKTRMIIARFRDIACTFE